MKTFKSYITEARMDHDAIVKAIAAYKHAGEILNPRFNELKSAISYAMRYGGNLGSKPNGLLELSRENRGDTYDEDLDNLYYTSFDSLASIGKIEKLAAKLHKKNNPKYKAMLKNVDEFVKAWKPVAADMKFLKTKIVKATQKRAEAKLAMNDAMAKKFADSSSLIRIFESHMEEYKKRAENEAKAFVGRLLDNLKKNGWDLDKIAPYPKSMNRDYKIMKNKRDLYQMVTKASKSSYSRGEPHIVDADQAKINHYIQMNVKGAEDAYRSFMEKMIQKIGKPVIDATMTGNIWTNATLTVTTDDGEQQVWSTKMIVNFSKYNKMFNQFPSRRKK